MYRPCPQLPTSAVGTGVSYSLPTSAVGTGVSYSLPSQRRSQEMRPDGVLSHSHAGKLEFPSRYKILKIPGRMKGSRI